MGVNPYESPRAETPVTGVLSGSRSDLRAVAMYQKGIVVCILLYFFGIAGRFAPLPRELEIVVMIGLLLVVLAGACFVVLLAMQVYGAGLGILFGILSIVPPIGLLLLLVINGKATKVLRQNGVKVGLLGANLADV